MFVPYSLFICIYGFSLILFYDNSMSAYSDNQFIKVVNPLFWFENDISEAYLTEKKKKIIITKSFIFIWQKSKISIIQIRYFGQ